MAVTIANEDRTVWGDRVVVTAKITLDSSYPNTGSTIGEPVTFDMFSGLQQIDSIVLHSTLLHMHRAVWDQTKQTIRCYVEDGTSGKEAEAANTTNLSGVACEVLVIGK